MSGSRGVRARDVRMGLGIRAEDVLYACHDGAAKTRCPELLQGTVLSAVPVVSASFTCLETSQANTPDKHLGVGIGLPCLRARLNFSPQALLVLLARSLNPEPSTTKH